MLTEGVKETGEETHGDGHRVCSFGVVQGEQSPGRSLRVAGSGVAGMRRALGLNEATEAMELTGIVLARESSSLATWPVGHD